MKQDKKVRDIMTKTLCTCTPNESVRDAAKLMDRYDIGFVAVCDREGCCTGVLTDRDMVIRCHAQSKDLHNTTVSEIMTKAPAKVTPDTTVDEALRLMSEYQIRRLPVEDNGVLVGILSIGDIARTCGCDAEIGSCECSIAEKSK